VLYDDSKVGLLKDGNVVDVSGVVPRGGTPQLTIEGLITNFQSLKVGLQRALDQEEGCATRRYDVMGGYPFCLYRQAMSRWAVALGGCKPRVK
jgi:hypothetical protein